MSVIDTVSEVEVYTSDLTVAVLNLTFLVQLCNDNKSSSIHSEKDKPSMVLT